MDPENQTTEPTAPVAPATEQPASPPAPQKPAGFFDQEDVNRIVAKRLEEDRARRPAAAQPAQKPTQPNKPAATTEPDLRAELEEMRRTQTELMQRLDYTSRAAKLGLDDTRSAALFKVYQANPDGFDEVVNALGIKASQPAAPAAPTPVTQIATPQPSATPISDKGSPAPGTGANWNREFADNPLNMSAAAISQMNAELGKEVAQRKRVEAALSRGLNIKVTPR